LSNFPILWVACAVFFLGFEASADAADFHVNSVADKVDATPGDGVCSTGSRVDGTTSECTLRAALDEVNALSKANPHKSYSIAIAAGTYSLTTAEPCLYQYGDVIGYLSRPSTALCITGDVTLVGAGAATTVINGGFTDRILYVSKGQTVAVNNVTLQGGVQTGGALDGGGGGINNQGSLSVANDVFTQNRSESGGGAIYSVGDLVVTGCTFAGNTGSAIFVGPSSTLPRTSIDLAYFTGNSDNLGFTGAAVLAYSGTLQISNSTLSGNAANKQAIVAAYNIPTTITNSTISFNTMGDSETIVSGGSGSALTLNNDTIYGNTSTGVGIAGVFADDLTLANTILAANGSSDCNVAHFTNLGHNLIGTADLLGQCLGGNNSTTLIGVDPKLGPLQIDGGILPTQTPLLGSPIIGKGSSAKPGSNVAGACTALDERGFVRAQHGSCTIGAAEALLGLQIVNVIPNTGGSGGVATLVIHGSGFVQGSTVTLQKNGQPDLIPAQTRIALDQTSIAVMLNLTAAAAGTYNVVIATPAGGSAVLAGAFTVQSGGAPNLYAYVFGSVAARKANPAFYSVAYGNKGNRDAYLVPLTLSLPGDFTASILGQVLPPPMAPGQATRDFTYVPVEVNPYSAAGFYNVPLIIPVIPAGSEAVLTFSMTPPENAAEATLYRFNANLGDPYGTSVSGALDANSLSQFVAGAQSYAQTYLGVTPSTEDVAKMSDYASAQLAGVVSVGEQALLDSAEGRPVFFSNAQLSIDVATYGAGLHSGGMASALKLPSTAHFVARQLESGAAPGSQNCAPGAVMLPGTTCNPDPTPVPSPGGPKPDGKIDRDDCAKELRHHVSVDGKSCVPDNPKGCGFLPNPFVPSNPDCGSFPIRASRDPNEKAGPLGLADAHFTSADNPFSYSIEFENSPSANGAAQSVTVTDALDLARFDLSTFRLGPISFGQFAVTPPAGVTAYAAALDLRPIDNVIVTIQASLDKSTGIATWHFTSLDPATMQLTTDANAGFLPPDTAPPAGIGHVTFSVNTLSSVPDGQICNTANIVFDANPAIATAAFCNTKDTSAPASHVLPLPSSTVNPTFTVSWTGADAGSGIDDYTVYVSDNLGAFKPLVTATAATSRQYTGVVGHQYGFYSLATDRLGKTEAAKKIAEASTSVVSSGRLTGDVNGDGVVNCADLMLVKAAFGSKTGQAAYDINADINGDGIVNIVDLATVARAIPVGVACH
jgi:CSLREA domain-containing protein